MIDLTNLKPAKFEASLKRYKALGLATPAQEGIIGRELCARPAGQRILDAAVAGKRKLTLDDMDKISGEPLRDADAYIMLFGRGPDINTFAVDPNEAANLVSEAVEREMPITDAELAHLDRNVLRGVDY